MKNASKSEKIVYCVLMSIVAILIIVFRSTIENYLEMMMVALAKFAYNIGPVWSTIVLIIFLAFTIGVFILTGYWFGQIEKSDKENRTEDKEKRF